jgi:hypothetical protein
MAPPVQCNALHSFPAGGKRAGDPHTVVNMAASGKGPVMGTIPTPGLATLVVNGAVCGPFDLVRDGPNEIVAKLNTGRVRHGRCEKFRALLLPPALPQRGRPSFCYSNIKALAAFGR